MHTSNHFHSTAEFERLQEIFNYHIPDTTQEKIFNDIVKIAKKTFNVPVAAITFADVDRQWVKTSIGLNFCETTRKDAVCNYTINQDELTEIADMSQDERFCHFPYVTGAPFYRYYAGFPLITQKGYCIGALCLLDTEVRPYLDQEEKELLQALARNAMAQVEIRLRNKELENLNEVQKRISCTLSHDIKNPITCFKTMLDMQDQAGTPLDADDLQKLNGLLKKQVNNTLGLLNNMIQWGKLQMQDSISKIKNVNLKQTVSETIKEIEVESLLKGNTFINAVPVEVSASVDYQGIQFTLRNLLSNANKYTDNGTITIGYKQSDTKEVIYVNDTGVGMTSRQVRDLNINKCTSYTNGTRNEKGNGLGLGLVHEYLAKNNCQLSFESHQGIGTTASFEL